MGTNCLEKGHSRKEEREQGGRRNREKVEGGRKQGREKEHGVVDPEKDQ
jgi:hypothetical protein